jgi:integrase
LTARLGIKTTMHKLRHYSATELIAAGVDIRPVSGRLGHGGGGTTTLRAYTAWVSESDQRAAGSLASRMPARPGIAPAPTFTTTELDSTSPYERIAVDLRTKIMEGKLRPGLPIPPVKELAAEHGTSVSTAHGQSSFSTSGASSRSTRADARWSSTSHLRRPRSW